MFPSISWQVHINSRERGGANPGRKFFARVLCFSIKKEWKKVRRKEEEKSTRVTTVSRKRGTKMYVTEKGGKRREGGEEQKGDGWKVPPRKKSFSSSTAYYQGTGGAFLLVAAKVHTFLLGRKNLFHRPFRKMKITPRKKKGGGEEENYKGEVRCSGIKRDGERKGGGAPLPAATVTHWVYAYRMYFSSSVHRSGRGRRRKRMEEEGPPPGLGWGPTQHLMEVVIWILLPQLLPLPSHPPHLQPFFLSPLLQSQVLSFFPPSPGKKGKKTLPPISLILFFSLEWGKHEKSLHIL